jgi:ABC-type Fe3+-hydroxamate transport system substrate-binding protein
MKIIDDDLDRRIMFGTPPKRIVSLVPSDTLSVFALGAGARLVGRTDYCDTPAEAAAIPSVGGTKNPRLDQIRALEPDLVLANKEENTKGDLEALVQDGFRVFVSFPQRARAGIAHLARLARMLFVEQDPTARALIKEAYLVIDQAEKQRAQLTPLRVFCPIWMDPLMTINGATFISDMLDLCGAQNIFADRERRYPLAADIGTAKPLPAERTAGLDVRYPRVTLQEVTERQPELVLLPDEPHAFSVAGIPRLMELLKQLRSA